MIPITRPVVGDAEAEAAAEVVRSGWLAQGKKVLEFEEVVASYVGASHAVAVSNGTAALHLVLAALNVGPGDEVLLPSLSFVATANAVRYLGARPVFVDVDPRSYNIDARDAARRVTARTRGVMPVHQVGLCADLAGIDALAARHGLWVIEDAACALGAELSGGRGKVGGDAGSSARARCFSFHPRKIITTGEGGMVTTADADLAARLRVLRSQGMSVPASERHGARTLVFEAYEELGYNYRLTDVLAAVGVAQMRRLPDLVAARQVLGRRYTALLAGVPGVTPPHEPVAGSHTYQSYMLVLDHGIDRNAVLQAMLARGVSARRAVQAIHLEPLYRRRQPDLTLPNTERVFHQGLMLPLYPGMTEQEQDTVVAALRAALA